MTETGSVVKSPFSAHVIWVAALLVIGSFFTWQMQKNIGPRLFFNWFAKENGIHNYFVRVEDQKTISSEDTCSICYSDFKSEVAFEDNADTPELSGGLQELLSNKRQSIMRTPCNHYFHISCLVTFMNYKQVCPLCRHTLPEIEFLLIIFLQFFGLLCFR